MTDAQLQRLIDAIEYNSSSTDLFDTNQKLDKIIELLERIAKKKDV